MSRLNLESSSLFDIKWMGGTWSAQRKTLTGNYTVLEKGPIVHFLDLGGIARNVTLPALKKGLIFVIANVGTSGDITVKDSLAATVTTVTPGNANLILSSSLEWSVVSGAGAGSFQPLDADLTSWALITRASGFDTFATTPSMANLGALLTNDAAGWTTFGTTPTSANLGALVTDDLFLLSDVELGAIAGLTSAADKVPYFTGLGTAALADLSSNMRTFMTTPSMANLGSLLTDDASGWTTFGTTPTSANLAALVTDDVFLLSDVELGAIAGLTSAADKFPYFTGLGTAALADLSSAMRTFLTTSSSANFKSVITDETGSGGALVFATAPTIDSLVGTTFIKTPDGSAASPGLIGTTGTTSGLFTGAHLVGLSSAGLASLQTSDTLSLALPAGHPSLTNATTLIKAASGVNAELMVVATGAAGAYMGFFSFGNPAIGQAANFFGLQARGTSSAPTQVLSGDSLFTIAGVGYDNTNVYGGAFQTDALFAIQAEENFTGTGHGTSMSFSVTPVGTASYVTSLKINAASLTPGFTNDLASLGTSGVSWSDLFLAEGGVINWDNGDLTLTQSGNTLTVAGGGLIVAAGTTANAGLLLTSGTNLTTPAAGGIEYDGKILMFDHAASARGVVPAVAYAFVPTGSDFTLAASNALQSYLPAATDVLTLVANTTYFFETIIYLTTGATTHTTAWSLLGGGSATIANILWDAVTASAAIGTQGVTETFTWGNVATAVILNATSIVTTTTITVRGQFRVSTGGTISPSIQFSANPTGTNLSKAGTFFRCWPAGSDTTASIGNWA